MSLAPILPHIFFGWTGSLGDRWIFGLVTMAGAWVAMFGIAAQFYSPTERVNAILLLPFVTDLSGFIGLTTGTIFAVTTLMVAAIAFIPLVLHSAGRSVLRFNRVASPTPYSPGAPSLGP